VLRDLCDETRHLRESVLRRVAAIGCRLDEARLPIAEAIVDGKIGELLFSPEYADARLSLELHGSETKVMTLLVLQCATAIDAKLGPPKRAKRSIARSDRPALAPQLVGGTEARP
jgi:hypothetical protein